MFDQLPSYCSPLKVTCTITHRRWFSLYLSKDCDCLLNSLDLSSSVAPSPLAFTITEEHVNRLFLLQVNLT